MEVNGAKGATVLFSVPSMDSWQLTTLNGGFPAIGQYIGVGKTSTNGEGQFVFLFFFFK